MAIDRTPTGMGETESICETPSSQEQCTGDQDTSDQCQHELPNHLKLPYRIVAHESRDEWLEWRQGKVGASDLGAIMGVSPFTSRLDLLKIKLGIKRVKDNPAMAHGRAMESTVLDMLKVRLNDPELASVTCESVQHPWMVAQLDGMSSKNLVEIKCPVSPKLLMSIGAGGIPLHYLYQLQAQMLVTGFEKSIFCVYFEQTLRLFEVPAERELQMALAQASKQFLQDVAEAQSRTEQ
jgi:putative phage-type endonuclease